MLGKLSDSLKRSRKGMFLKIRDVLKRSRISNEDVEEIEELLILGDVSADIAEELTNELRKRLKIQRDLSPLEVLKEIMKEDLREENKDNITYSKPYVILVVGVNGVGKTTAAAKLAKRYIEEGKSVLLGAADTFRAAAIEQLQAWGKKVGAEVIAHKTGADAGAVAYDTVKAAIARDINVAIIDTAGRLHTKHNLIEELKKISRVIKKVKPSSPEEVLLVLDATTGQNSIKQAHIFKEAVGVNGLIVTKLDGTAKGGTILSIKREFAIPVKFIGIGEGVDDLKPFNADEFVDAMFEGGNNGWEKGLLAQEDDLSSLR
ncbi:MAG: signal recognition particle-docking protein FtsY [Thermotoga sp.]|nr:MAG: signal recognition particle-docking protein FtsY [Thermotoga sp.]